MNLNSLNNETVDFMKFDGIIFEKQSSILSVTKLVLALSVLMAVIKLTIK
jgi:hypothetical protein